MIDLLKFAKMFSHTPPPVPAAALGSGWGYTPPLQQYTRQIWSQFSIIRKVFLLIFPRISISHYVKQEIPRQHTIYDYTGCAVYSRTLFPIQKQLRYIYVNPKRLLQIIIVHRYRGWWANKNNNKYSRKRFQSTK